MAKSLARWAYPGIRSGLLRSGIDVRRATTTRRQLFDAVLSVRDAQRACGPSPSLDPFVEFAIMHAARSYSQRFQDLLVLYLLGDQSSGFFVEFGAADGETNSNTALLEREFGWTGILSGPARIWHDSLRLNRSSNIDARCVSAITGGLVEFSENLLDPQLSTVTGTANRTFATTDPAKVRKYTVERVSLMDLLESHSAPAVIDYVSIDTEGTEWDILEPFDFDSYQVRVLTVEHNGEPNRSRIKGLLQAWGYRRILEDVSGWDDWYVHPSVDVG